jgi:hypothetical protein
MEEAIFSAQKNARSAAGIFNITWQKGFRNYASKINLFQAII